MRIVDDGRGGLIGSGVFHRVVLRHRSRGSQGRRRSATKKSDFISGRRPPKLRMTNVSEEDALSEKRRLESARQFVLVSGAGVARRRAGQGGRVFEAD